MLINNRQTFLRATAVPAFSLSSFPGGGGAFLYNLGYGCASGTFKPLPFADQFRQNFGPSAAKWRKIFENIYPKTPENEFLAVYLCIIEKMA